MGKAFSVGGVCLHKHVFPGFSGLFLRLSLQLCDLFLGLKESGVIWFTPFKRLELCRKQKKFG